MSLLHLVPKFRAVQSESHSFYSLSARPTALLISRTLSLSNCYFFIASRVHCSVATFLCPLTRIFINTVSSGQFSSTSYYHIPLWSAFLNHSTSLMQRIFCADRVPPSFFFQPFLIFPRNQNNNTFSSSPLLKPLTTVINIGSPARCCSISCEALPPWMVILGSWCFPTKFLCKVRSRQQFLIF